MRRTSHMTLERAETVRRAFGLRDFPHKMPYDADIGLDLPNYLTSKEIRTIAACAAASVVEDTPWYIGDLLIWLQVHPESPIERDWVRTRLFRVGRYTKRTFDNYTSVCRTFPLKERIAGLSFRHHDALRARWIPDKLREELFRKALDERMSPDDLAKERNIRQREIQGSDPRSALRDELYQNVRELYRLTTFPETAQTDEELLGTLKSVDKLVLRFQKYLDKRRKP